MGTGYSCPFRKQVESATRCSCLLSHSHRSCLQCPQNTIQPKVMEKVDMVQCMMDMDMDMVISGMKPGEVTITPGMDMAAMPYRRTLMVTPGLWTCTAASVRPLATTNTTWSTTKRQRGGRRKV